MNLGLGKFIGAEQRVEPEVQEEARKVAVLEHETTRAEVLAVLRQDEIDILPLQMRECLDDAVRRHDRDILQHQRLETASFKQMRFEGLGRVHDECMRAQVEEVC